MADSISRSNNEIVMFTFPITSQTVRVIFDENGKPWWIAKDVCEVLGIDNPSQALTRLDDDEKGVVLNDTLGGSQRMVTVSESGLYSLILTSRKPGAKEFKKWVTSEVLPSIRKTGGYGKNRVADILDDPAQANTLMLELLTRNNNLKEENLQLAAKVSDQAPKVAAFDRLDGSEGSMCVTDAAKTLSIQPKKLFDYLSSVKWIYKRIGSSVWLGYQDKIQSGMLEHVTSEVTKPDGSTVVKTRVKVTAKGIARLALELNGPFFN